MPKSVVFGGQRYFSQMSHAQALIRFSSCLPSRLGQFSVSLLLGIDKTLIIFDGELGVDGQPDDFILVFATARQFDGELDPLAFALWWQRSCRIAPA